MKPHLESRYGVEDDEVSSIASSSGSIGKPTTTFDTQDQDLEDAFYARRKRGERSWWQRMVVRARRRTSLNDSADGLDQTLLQDPLSAARIARKRSCYSCCVFGGISGLSVLAFLLFVNLSLGIATLVWPSKVDHVLENWGQPGTGTEGLAWYPTDFLRDVTPISCHSHNDYWRRVPLFDALRAGCTGVEADVWLFDNDLFVGHNTASLTRNRTFTSLYIDPLVKILEHQNPDTIFYNGTSHGVFDTDPEQSLTLLVDVKTAGAETWPWVVDQLQPLRERGWLSFVENNEVHFRAITVVGTGNTPFDTLTSNSTYRDTFFDAPLDQMWESRDPNNGMKNWHDSDVDGLLPDEKPEGDEGSTAESSTTPAVDVGQGMSGVLPTDKFNQLNSYYASVSFRSAVGMMWRRRLTPRQMKIIRGQVRGAHRRGLKARYWDLPSWPLGLRNHVWDVLIKEGVDVLNVDDLRAASKQVW